MNDVPQPRIHRETAELFYSASESARTAIDEILVDYRSNTTKVLALATGALTLFGFEDSAKGGFFYAAVITYLLAALVSIALYRPVGWYMNVAHDMVDRSDGPIRGTDRINNLGPATAHYFLGRGHQIAIERNLAELTRRFGVVRKFQLVAFLAALTVVFGGLNMAQNTGEDAEDSPTRVILIDEEQP